jgi:hypothetical protein
MFAIAGMISASCEPWCNHPCAELNGSPSDECASCSSPVLCRPGADGYALGNDRNAERDPLRAAVEYGAAAALQEERLFAHASAREVGRYLGAWWANASLTRVLAAQLDRGTVQIHNFLAPWLAEALLTELESTSHWEPVTAPPSGPFQCAPDSDCMLLQCS